MTVSHQNGTFPSENASFSGEARYSANPVSGIHGNPTRHIAAPRVDRSRPTMTARRNESNPFYSQHDQQLGATVSHRRPPMNKAFEAKGHDAALAHCQNHALPVTVQTLTSETAITGVIARRDRFTVTIERPVPGKEGWVYHEVIFKHAIESIGLPHFERAAVH